MTNPHGRASETPGARPPRVPTVTRDDVAKAAGLSPSVVSYVLNDGPRPVSARARERVLAAVQALGYRPDGLARSLRMGRTHSIGLVIPDAANPFFAELARHIEDAAFARDLAVLVCNSADDADRERRYIANLTERRVDGLILVSARDSQDLTGLIDLRIPVVAMDRTPDDSPISTVRAMNDDGARRGTIHLLEHGHELVAFVGGPDSSVTDARRTGWRAALAEHESEIGPESNQEFSYEGGYRAASELFAAAMRPTAVLVSSDVQAIGLLTRLVELELDVPKDVAVVSIDGTRAGAHAIPALTTLQQPLEQMATHVLDRLMDAAPPTHVSFEMSLIRRRSCGCTG